MLGRAQQKPPPQAIVLYVLLSIVPWDDPLRDAVHLA
jgi:hypothetical protein